MAMTSSERAGWQAAAQVIEAWTEGIAVVDGAVAVAVRVEDALVIDVGVTREPAATKG